MKNLDMTNKSKKSGTRSILLPLRSEIHHQTTIQVKKEKLENLLVGKVSKVGEDIAILITNSRYIAKVTKNAS